MANPEVKDYLHEELQRRARETEFEEQRYILRRNRRLLQRRMIALFFVVVSIPVALYLVLTGQSDAFQIPLILTFGAAFSGFALYYLQPSSIGRQDFPADFESFRRTRYYVDERLAEVFDELRNLCKTLPQVWQESASAGIL